MFGDDPAVPAARPKSKLPDGPEFIVSREAFDRYFERPIPTSTFHDLVSKGKVVPWSEMRGRYYLNASLKRMGLPAVRELPTKPGALSLEDVFRYAFTLIDPLLFSEPPAMLTAEVIDASTVDHAKRIAIEHREIFEALSSTEEKQAYFAGVLDAQVVIENRGLPESR